MKKLIGQLGGLGEIQTLKSQIRIHGDEILMLRKAVYGEHWRNYGGSSVLTEEDQI